MIKKHINKNNKMFSIFKIYTKIKSFFTKVEEVEEYCCQECPSIEMYNEMDEIYARLIAEGELSQEIIEKHIKSKPIPCKKSELTPCSECSKMLCPNCTETGLKWGKHYHPWKEEPFVKCDACCWNEVT